MSSRPAVPMNAQRERNPHLVALAALAATLAEPTPCASEDSRLWISEDRDQREWAAGLCVGCPLLAACRAAGRAEVFGVWGGRDRSPVRPAEPAGPEFESGLIRAALLVRKSRSAGGHKSGHNAADPAAEATVRHRSGFVGRGGRLRRRIGCGARTLDWLRWSYDAYLTGWHRLLRVWHG